APRRLALSALRLCGEGHPAALCGGAVRRGQRPYPDPKCPLETAEPTAVARCAQLRCDCRRFFRGPARRMGTLPRRCRARGADRLPGETACGIADRPGRT